MSYHPIEAGQHPHPSKSTSTSPTSVRPSPQGIRRLPPGQLQLPHQSPQARTSAAAAATHGYAAYSHSHEGYHQGPPPAQGLHNAGPLVISRPGRSSSFTSARPSFDFFSSALAGPATTSHLPPTGTSEGDSYFNFNPPPIDSPSMAPSTPSGMPGHPSHHQGRPPPHMGPGRPDAHGYPMQGGHYPPQHHGSGYMHQPPPFPHPGPSSHQQGMGQSQMLGGQEGQPAGNGGAAAVTKKTGGASDFVKKLYKMLEDDEYATVVSWGNNGDSFVVKDMNEFTKAILPRHFKHSNFASFVRQLNKYDFHKVKNPEEGPSTYGDHTWEFRHPNFRADTKNQLDSIKRKAPTGRKPGAADVSAAAASSSSAAGGSTPSGSGENLTALQSQVEALNRMQHDMNSHITTLSKDYQSVISDMMNFQRSMVAQDQLMQNLIQYLVTLEADKKESNVASTSTAGETPFIPSDQAQKLISSYTDVARASFEQMHEISRRASVAAAGHAAAFQGYGQAPLPKIEAASPALYPPHTSASRAVSPGGVGEGQTPDSTSTGSSGAQRGSSLRPGRAGGSMASPQSGQAVLQGQAQSPTTPHDPSNGDMNHPPHVDSANGNAPTPGSSSSSMPNFQQNVGTMVPAGFAPMGMRDMDGLRVFTVGHLRPRDENDGSPEAPGGPGGGRNGMDGQYGLQVPSLDELPADMPRLDATGANADMHGYGRSGGSPFAPDGSPLRVDASPELMGSGNGNAEGQTLRIRRSTYVPGWAVPPRVLLVEDDAVCRKLSSKFLQVFGCAIDVAVDGVSAVNKMNLAKYDLVLMDIVMPNLDGVSATSLIRQFDPMTPIISMTSNSNPADIMSYFSHGMNDILPKPFTKEGLLTMLEKHLNHLKAMQQMAEIPRALGVPEDQIANAMIGAVGGIPGFNPPPFVTGNGGEGVDGSSGGMSMNEYVAMIQNLVNAESDGGGKVAGQKRIGGPDRDEEERETKRSRFVEERDLP